jgi:uncharacterized membrane protein YfcA
MSSEMLLLLTFAIAAAATLYSSVGHGGASAYIALMALFGLAPEEIRPTALVLNIIVAGYAAFTFLRAGRFDWRVFWPFAITAIPAAYFAGRIDVPESVYRPLLAAALAAAALRYLLWPKLDAEAPTRPPRLAIALPAGLGLGALAGLTGIGGGVYLSPLLIFARWSDAHRTAGIAACFILVNSIAGLAGRWSSLAELPPFLPQLVAAALAGALLGASFSVAKFDRTAILRSLGCVLGVAAIALFW